MNKPKNEEEPFFKIPFAIGCIAKRESGKSYLTKYLVKYWLENKDIDYIFAVTNTGEMNKEYDYLPKDFVNARYDENFIRGIMETQKEHIKKWGLKSKKVKNVLIILDDVIGSLPPRNKTLQELYSQGRHYKISIILNIQISKNELDTVIRDNLDYFIIGHNGKRSYSNLYKELDFPENESEFQKFMHDNTIDHQFVVYNNKVIKSPDPLSRYKIIKAEGNMDKYKAKF